MPQNYLRRLDYATVRSLRYRYFHNRSQDHTHSLFYVYQSIYRDYGDHVPFTLAVFVTTHLQVGKLIQDTPVL